MLRLPNQHPDYAGIPRHTAKNVLPEAVMNPILSRRSVLESTLAVSLGALGGPRARLGSFEDDSTAAVNQIPAGAFNVREFGAKGDGSTDDARAFQTAIATAGRVNGVVLVPASATKYILGSSLTLAPNTTIQGAGAQSPTLRLNGAADSLFNFVGITEAQGLNVTLSNLALESGSNRKGVGIRVRNFSNLFLRHVNINHFNIGLSADWGLGVHVYGCDFVHNVRGLQVGSTDGSGGVRGGARKADPFVNTVVVNACGFAQNELDINDMGSTGSLGGIVIEGCSFFEAYTNPVASKYQYVRLANRKGITIYGNCFEGGQGSRTFIYLGNHDYEGNATGMCHGAAIYGNHFLQTGLMGTVGVDLTRCEAATIMANCFEFAAGNSPIRMTDSVGRNTVGQNSYLTYPDREGYPTPVTGVLTHQQVLDPRMPARIGKEVQIAGRVASAVVALTYGGRVPADAAAANYFSLGVTDSKPFSLENPSNPTAGQQLTYDIRNISGSEMGTIEWGSAFLLAGPFMSPVHRRRRTITFYYDGTNWVETNRSVGDI